MTWVAPLSGWTTLLPLLKQLAVDIVINCCETTPSKEMIFHFSPHYQESIVTAN